MIDVRAERVQTLAWKLAQFGACGTMLVLCYGGYHYLSTTNGMSRPGSLTYLGLVKWPLLLAVLGLAVGLAVECYDYVDQRLRERRAESRPISEITGKRFR